MNASEARELAKKNSEFPKDILLLIKKAAKKGKTSLILLAFDRYLERHEIDGLKLLGYKVKDVFIRDCSAIKISWA